MQKPEFKVLRKFNKDGVKYVKYRAAFRVFDEETMTASYVQDTFEHSWADVKRTTSPGVSYWTQLKDAFK